MDQTPTLPDHITVERDGHRSKLVIDGEAFPYTLSRDDEPTIETDMFGEPIVRVALRAKSIQLTTYSASPVDNPFA